MTDKRPSWIQARAAAAARVFLIVLPIALIGAVVVLAHSDGSLAIDFRTVSPEIRGLAHGQNPYSADSGLAAGGHFLWTVGAGWALAPLAWLPGGWAFMVVLQIIALLLALRLFGVRDWRCYALAAVWPATVNSVQTANISLPMMLLIAAGWHHRKHTRAGLFMGAAVGAKLFLWPVVFWLAATRRFKALGAGLVVTGAAVLAAWPYLSLGDYVRFERTVIDLFGPDALTLPASLHDLGVPMQTGRLIAYCVGGTILWFGRRDLGWMVIAALVVSPIVWLHYFDLLAIPLSLWHARLWVWSLPLLLVIAPGKGNGAPWQTIGTLIAFALTVLAAHRSSRRATQKPTFAAISASPQL